MADPLIYRAAFRGAYRVAAFILPVRRDAHEADAQGTPWGDAVQVCQAAATKLAGGPLPRKQPTGIRAALSNNDSRRITDAPAHPGRARGSYRAPGAGL